VKIIEISESTVDDKKSWQYYIHYFDFNRRVDEWITCDRILVFPKEANNVDTSTSHLKLSGLFNLKNDFENHEAATTKTKDENENHLEANREVVSTQPTTVNDLNHNEHEGLDATSLLEHEEVTKIKNVKFVQLGKYIMECWYFSPFPNEFIPNNGFIECLYFCEFSFRFFRTKNELKWYQNKSKNLLRHPPGNEIYRDDKVSMFELDAAVEKIYCQNLSYFAKLFLDHKTLYWDVDHFLFYVLCTRDERGFHPVGYFSKEKFFLFNIFLFLF
jgi:histone acetyltransferase MYST1